MLRPSLAVPQTVSWRKADAIRPGCHLVGADARNEACPDLKRTPRVGEARLLELVRRRLQLRLLHALRRGHRDRPFGRDAGKRRSASRHLDGPQPDRGVIDNGGYASLICTGNDRYISDLVVAATNVTNITHVS
jgi:hypothetical protein